LITVGYSVYDNLPNVERSINSLLPHVDKIYAIFGKYKWFDNSGYSFYASRNWLVKQEKVILKEIEAIQWIKRNQYLKLARADHADVLLYIDSDEWIKQIDTERFHNSIAYLTRKYPQEHIFGINMEYSTSGLFCPYPKLILRPYELEYYRSHKVMKHLPSGHKFQVTKDLYTEDKCVEGILLGHNDMHRTELYLSRSKTYKKKNMQYEMGN